MKFSFPPLICSLTTSVIVLLHGRTPCLAFTTASETIFVSNYWGDNVRQYDLTGADLGTFVTSALSGPGDLAFDQSGTLYAADYSGNRIMRFTRDGVGTVFASTGLWNPQGLAFDPAGNLYVANYGNSTIMKFAPNGVGSVFATTGLNHPMGLTIDSLGNVYAANYEGHSITKFTSAGVGSIFANSGLYYPWGLACDANDNIFVANFWGNNITKFTPNGVGSLFASVYAQYSSLRNLAFDGAGNLYAVNYDNNSLMKFTPDHQVYTLTTSGLSNPTGIAILAVPEPTGAGLFLLGWAAWKVEQKRKARPATK